MVVAGGDVDLVQGGEVFGRDDLDTRFAFKLVTFGGEALFNFRGNFVQDGTQVLPGVIAFKGHVKFDVVRREF